MPQRSTLTSIGGASGPADDHPAPSPWLNFFREVRRLAATLDALEQNVTNGDGEGLSQ